MTLTTDACLAAITHHTRALAAAARDNLSAPVEHCPGWTVADLVAHLAGVHWFWGTIAARRLAEPVPPEDRPARPSDDVLVDTLLTGADRLVDVLGNTDQSTPVWTWYPAQQDVAFITRHQVQEAAVHHFDAASAAGAAWAVDPAVAVDAVEEYLTVSLADDADVARLGVALPGPLVLVATDAERSWTVHQPTAGAGLTWTSGPAYRTDATVSAPVADLLLWLYRRTDLADTDRAAVDAFRTLSSS
jgi:uncharacterized protein (TIGR03083 family)